MESLLVKQEKYLESGIHIGTKMKVADMEPFIYRKRNDGLYVLDLRKVDECLRNAATHIGNVAPEDILVVASRTYSGNAAAKFSKILGCKVLLGRFVPGTLTNVTRPYFCEPKLMVVCDPKAEHQAIIEAVRMNIPVVSLCDTDNTTKGTKAVIPCNNKGRRSLALIFYILAREYFMSQKRISTYDEFALQPENFESDDAYREIKGDAEEEAPAEESAPADAAQPEAGEAPAQEAAPAKKPRKPRKKKETGADEAESKPEETAEEAPAES